MVVGVGVGQGRQVGQEGQAEIVWVGQDGSFVCVSVSVFVTNFVEGVSAIVFVTIFGACVIVFVYVFVFVRYCVTVCVAG